MHPLEGSISCEVFEARCLRLHCCEEMGAVLLADVTVSDTGGDDLFSASPVDVPEFGRTPTKALLPKPDRSSDDVVGEAQADAASKNSCVAEQLLRGKKSGDIVGSYGAPSSVPVVGDHSNEAFQLGNLKGVIAGNNRARSFGKPKTVAETIEIKILPGGRGPRRVCGKLFQSMPEKAPFCSSHTRVVESMKASYTKPKHLDVNPYAEELRQLEEVIRKSGPPPSALSRLVYDHMESNPIDPATGARKRYDIQRFYQKFMRQTLVRTGWKMVLMNIDEFKDHIVTKERIDEAEASRRWRNKGASIDDCHKHYDGPPGKPLRMPVVVEINKQRTTHATAAVTQTTSEISSMFITNVDG